MPKPYLNFNLRCMFLCPTSEVPIVFLVASSLPPVPGILWSACSFRPLPLSGGLECREGERNCSVDVLFRVGGRYRPSLCGNAGSSHVQRMSACVCLCVILRECFFHLLKRNRDTVRQPAVSIIPGRKTDAVLSGLGRDLIQTSRSVWAPEWPGDSQDAETFFFLQKKNAGVISS